MSTDPREPSRKPSRAPGASACEAYRELSVEALGLGRNAMAIWQDLVDDHGFSARFTGSTERKALDWLTSLGAEVKVSYDTPSTRLHAKAWMYRRDTGYSTAYIGLRIPVNPATHSGEGGHCAGAKRRQGLCE